MFSSFIQAVDLKFCGEAVMKKWDEIRPSFLYFQKQNRKRQ